MIFDFGKYNGKSIEEIYKKDPSYINFLLSKPWFEKKYPDIFKECKNIYIKNIKIDNNKLYIYTDGACPNNGRKNSKCGIGIHFSNDIEDISEKLDIEEPTNNKAELIAILKALEKIDGIDKDIEIYSDSKYSINCIEVWYPNWIKENKLKDKKNIDIIEKIYPLYKKNNIKFNHIYAHTNKGDIHSIGNSIADKLATDILK